MTVSPRQAPGLFITFEGGEGSGKSSVSARVVAALRADGVDVVTTREPGGSAIGPVLRSLLLDPDGEPIGPRTEALLFAADRAHHVQTVISPALAAGATVLCDRYLDSSIAYQGVSRGLGADRIRELSLWAADGLLPDLTVLLDVDPVLGLARRGATGQVDRLDAEDIAFHEQVRATFLALATTEPDRFVVLDASAPVDVLVDAALTAIRARL